MDHAISMKITYPRMIPSTANESAVPYYSDALYPLFYSLLFIQNMLRQGELEQWRIWLCEQFKWHNVTQKKLLCCKQKVLSMILELKIRIKAKLIFFTIKKQITQWLKNLILASQSQTYANRRSGLDNSSRRQGERWWQKWTLISNSEWYQQSCDWSY